MKRKLESMEDLLQAVEYYGFLPFFHSGLFGGGDVRAGVLVR